MQNSDATFDSRVSQSTENISQSIIAESHSKKIRPDFIEDEATDAHSVCILLPVHYIPNGRETISLLPFDKRVPWPELPSLALRQAHLNDGQQTIVAASFFY